jgi:hypothetical protein
LTFFANRGADEVFRHGAFVEGAILFSERDDQPSLWKDRIRLDENFYRALYNIPYRLVKTHLGQSGRGPW